MFELIAEGVGSEYRWRRTLPADIEFQLGRSTVPWSVHWDSSISRHHFDLLLREGQLEVVKIPDAVNPIFYQGQSRSEFRVAPGEHFVVGNTTFTLIESNAFATQDLPDPVRQQTFSHEFLRQLPYRDANRRMQVLNRIPAIIASAGDEQVLLNQFASLILAGIPLATATGIVVVNDEAIEILHWDGQSNEVTEFQPSDRLIRAGVEENESVLHIWSSDSRESPYTLDSQNDWAFVVPMAGEVCRNWGVYVCGRSLNPDTTPNTDSVESTQEDVKFCELVTSTLANVLQLKSLERRQTSLRPFFAPVVLSALRGRDPEEILQPRECDVSVIFCDLRGFSRASEMMAGDLTGLLEQVSQKLGIATHQILNHGGVVGDFHGDAVMGFWGWPRVGNLDSEASESMESQMEAQQAVEAALEIQARIHSTLRASTNDEIEVGDIGIGIASGKAVVGKIGTADQVKVTALGPVVNLASRLEGLNKKFGTKVLLDQKTAEQLGAVSNLRRICRVQPFGLQTKYNIYELATEVFQDSHLRQYRRALSAFELGEWEEASRLFRDCPGFDSVAAYLFNWIEEHPTPPQDWDGVVIAESK